MEPYIGQIMMFAGNFAPRGWAFCNGQLMSIAQNTALFSILGTTYGGDGKNTFALPDLRSRVPVHPGQGPGLSAYTLGEVGGTETVTLTTPQIPAHGHAFQIKCSNSTSDAETPENNVPAPSTPNFNYATQSNALMANEGISSVVGGSQPHTNVQPYSCVNFIIAIQGIFPSRN
jgi:microcystin-dependent protein